LLRIQTIALLSLFLSFSAHGVDERLLTVLRALTRNIPAHSVVTWSRAPLEIAFNEKSEVAKIGEAVVLLGFRPLDSTFQDQMFGAPATISSVFYGYAEDTPDNEPLYSVTKLTK